MANHKGAPKTGGRQKGTPNKTTKAIREMVSDALDKAGGVEYLVRQSEEQPVAFMGLVGKVLPLQVNADLTARLLGEVVFRGIND